jgi:hypothetical protein
VYEQEFHSFSYSFRPRRSAHQAGEAFRTALVRMAGCVVEVDIPVWSTCDIQGCERVVSGVELHNDETNLVLIGRAREPVPLARP